MCHCVHKIIIARSNDANVKYIIAYKNKLLLRYQIIWMWKGLQNSASSIIIASIRTLRNDYI